MTGTPFLKWISLGKYSNFFTTISMVLESSAFSEGERKTKAISKTHFNFIIHPFNTDHSFTFGWTFSSSLTERNPNPLNGFWGSHGMGAFLGTEPGAGRGKIKLLAE